MAYTDRVELKEHVGKMGVFVSDSDTFDSVYYGKLIAVTKNGNCEGDNNVYYDYFVPKNLPKKNVNRSDFTVVCPFCNKVNDFSDEH